MASMRAKMVVLAVEKLSETHEKLRFTAVAKFNGYPPDGSDEDNTYAKFSPSGSVELTVANPALLGKFAVGEKYYIDFHKAE